MSDFKKCKDYLRISNSSLYCISFVFWVLGMILLTVSLLMSTLNNHSFHVSIFGFNWMYLISIILILSDNSELIRQSKLGKYFKLNFVPTVSTVQLSGYGIALLLFITIQKYTCTEWEISAVLYMITVSGLSLCAVCGVLTTADLSAKMKERIKIFLIFVQAGGTLILNTSEMYITKKISELIPNADVVVISGIIIHVLTILFCHGFPFAVYKRKFPAF